MYKEATANGKAGGQHAHKTCSTVLVLAGSSNLAGSQAGRLAPSSQTPAQRLKTSESPRDTAYNRTFSPPYRRGSFRLRLRRRRRLHVIRLPIVITKNWQGQEQEPSKSHIVRAEPPPSEPRQSASREINEVTLQRTLPHDSASWSRQRADRSSRKDRTFPALSLTARPRKQAV